MSLNPGQKLGSYEIEEQIGAGGMGEVYRARDPRLERTVAIKVLPERTADSADLKERFQREARAISSLSHPNICILHDVGEQDGRDYLVMEYLEGETLAERLTTGPVGTPEMMRIAIQIADALDSAHRQGLVHRDLKPGNVMITRDGAKLLDFGLAKLTIADTPPESFSALTLTAPLTTEGALVGTMHYMAPEQLEGKEADARSDIFAFGALLYEMATGKRPFDGASQASLIASVLKEEPPSVTTIQPMIPPLLEQAISQCLMKDPDQRWQTAGDLKRTLRWVSEGGSQIGTPAPVVARRKHRELVLGIVAAVLAVASAGLGYATWRSSQVEEPLIQTNVMLEDGSLLDDLGGGSVVISPDGTTLAWVARDSMAGEPRLWVRRLDALSTLPLPGTEDAMFPFWSPDSRYLAFFAGGKLKKVLATGGPTLTLCPAENGRSGAWNEDGDILFTPTQADVLHRVSAAGGEAVPISVRDTTSADFTHRWATFLPSGRDYLFFARTGGGGGSELDAICVASLDRPEVKRLIRAKSNPLYHDGKILFVRDGVLMAQDFDPGSWEVGEDAVPVAERVSYLASWSKGVFSIDGRGTLVYRQGEISAGSMIRQYDLEGKLLREFDEQTIHYSVRISHDGTRAVLNINDQSQLNIDLWVLDLRRNIRNRLTFHESRDVSPAWSPDDSLIAWASSHPERPGVYVKAANGAGEERLVYPTSNQIFVTDWSPDGKYLCAVESRDSRDLVIIPLGPDEEPFTFMATAAGEYDGRFSPDGRWLAFGSDESGKEEVYVAAFPQRGGKWQVSLREGDRPRWKQDGSVLYYLDNTDKINEAEVDGSGSAFKVGAVRPLFEVQGARPGSIYEVFPDGSGFLVNERMTELDMSRLVLVQNWTRALIR
jgi:Tol biopolymer transport system component